MVEFFSAEMVLRVCRYRNCMATGLQAIILDAAFSAPLAFCSPSAAITCNTKSEKCSTRSHLPWPAPPLQPLPLQPWLSEAALATSHLCWYVQCDNNANSNHKTYISTLSTVTPHGSVASSNVVLIQWAISSLSNERIITFFYI